MRVIMPVIIDRAGRNFNADETDGVSGRDRIGSVLYPLSSFFDPGPECVETELRGDRQGARE